MIFRKDMEQCNKEHLDLLVVVQIITKKLCKLLRYKCLVSPGLNGTHFLQPCLCVNSAQNFGFNMLYTFCYKNMQTVVFISVFSYAYTTTIRTALNFCYSILYVYTHTQTRTYLGFYFEVPALTCPGCSLVYCRQLHTSDQDGVQYKHGSGVRVCPLNSAAPPEPLCSDHRV